MTLRDCVHAAGRLLTRALLHPRWRRYRPMSWLYLQLYLLGKRLTERQELANLRKLIAPGMVIADIGANAGFYTLEMASMVGPEGRILAFEPDAFNSGLLQERTRRARVSNVEVMPVAIGNKSGRATLYCSAYNRADNRLHQSHQEAHVEATEVQVRSLDEILSDRGTPAIDAMKIDVQGAEEQVLRGARTTLAHGLRWIWIEFSPSHLRGAGTEPESLLSLLSGLGMDIFEVDRGGGLRPLSDFRDYTRRIDASYGDLVLISADPASSGLAASSDRR